MKSLVALIGLIGTLGLLAGCSRGTTASPSLVEDRVVGVVVAVDGDLGEIRSFSVVVDDGTTIEFAPEAGLLFDGGPLSHLRDHLVSGAPVAVKYRSEADLSIATSVGDGE